MLVHSETIHKLPQKIWRLPMRDKHLAGLRIMYSEIKDITRCSVGQRSLTGGIFYFQIPSMPDLMTQPIIPATWEAEVRRL